MANTETTDTQELLAVANRASSILARILDERSMSTNPTAFIEETTTLSNELTQILSQEFPFLSEDGHVFLDIADPTPTEDPDKWHPHISIEHQGKHGNAYLDFDKLPSDHS